MTVVDRKLMPMTRFDINTSSVVFDLSISSVNRWPDHVFNIWVFTTMLIYPKILKNGQIRLNILPKYYLNFPKMAKDK